MKVGDLVKWTFPGYEDYGVIVGIKSYMESDIYGGIPCGHAHIMWTLRPEHSGYYPTNQKYLEVVA